MKRATTLVAVLIAAFPLEAPAQAPTRIDTITRALAGLPDVPVRLRQADLISEFDRLELRDGRFNLRGREGQRTLIPGEVSSIWVLESRPARAAFVGMAWGAAIGFAGGALGTIVEGGCDYCINDPIIAGVIFAIPGLVLGTIAGASIEVAFPRWRRVYP